jgi:hypothetical protein
MVGNQGTNLQTVDDNNEVKAFGNNANSIKRIEPFFRPQSQMIFY